LTFFYEFANSIEVGYPAAKFAKKKTTVASFKKENDERKGKKTADYCIYIYRERVVVAAEQRSSSSSRLWNWRC